MAWICLSAPVWTGYKMFSLLEVETGGLDLPVCISTHVWNVEWLALRFSLLEVETGGLDLPVCASAHVLVLRCSLCWKWKLLAWICLSVPLHMCWF
jgi:hypothetical protein